MKDTTKQDADKPERLGLLFFSTMVFALQSRQLTIVGDRVRDDVAVIALRLHHGVKKHCSLMRCGTFVAQNSIL